ncbi:MAG: ATP-binding protein [Cyclobacteriaceae bacterium]
MMALKNNSVFNEKVFARFSRNYVIALPLVAFLSIVGQVFIQIAIKEQEKDSHIINLAGRQRMLSVQIGKLSLLTNSNPKNEFFKKDLKKKLLTWGKYHTALKTRNSSYGFGGENSRVINQLFRKIEPHYQNLKEKACFVLSLQGGELPKGYMNSLLGEEALFLSLMNKIVFQYDRESQRKLQFLKTTEIILFTITILVLFAEALFIFRPSIKGVKNAIYAVKESERKAKKVATKLSETNYALGHSLRALENSNLALTEATLMVKLTPSGLINYANANFYKLLGYKEGELLNTRFNLLSDKYESPFIFNKLWASIEEGEIWKHELVLHTKEGKQLWMDMTCTPLTGLENEVTTCLAVFTTISSKIEEKVDEQRIKSISVLEGQEDERQRIARELHDGLGQILSALKFNVDSLKLEDSEKQQLKLEGIKKMLYDTISETRKISFNLMPSVLGDYGLVSALKILTEELTKHTDIKMTFSLENEYTRVDKTKEVTIYRTVQEAINNAIKYSESETLDVVMDATRESILISISDHGKGFDSSIPRTFSSQYGRGMVNMRERIKLVKGKFSIDSVPGKGTRVFIEVPISG